jgi:hypothetical protein
MENQQKPRFVWTPVYTIMDERTRIAIRVTRNDKDKPDYTFTFGNILPGDNPDTGKLLPFIRCGVQYKPTGGVTGEVSMSDFSDVFTRLCQEMQAWVEENAESVYTAKLRDWAEARERKQLEMQKPKQAPGLKSGKLRDQARAAGGK